MIDYSGHLKELMVKAGFPAESWSVFLDADRCLFNSKIFSEKLDDIFIRHKEKRFENKKEMLGALSELSAQAGIHEYTMHLLFFMYLAKDLREEYEKQNIPVEIYLDSMRDLGAKLIECKEVHGVWGSFVASWFTGFFEVDRFALGRLQYEPRTFGRETYEKNGVVVDSDDLVYNIHIPSLGPLTIDSVYDSFRRAYGFFKQNLDKEHIVFVCGSWLLYKEHYDFLPSSSNILKFMDCFDIIESHDNDFGDAWRIFGRFADLPPEQLPHGTSLQKAYRDRLLGGQKTGSGFGVAVFDGEKIINK